MSVFVCFERTERICLQSKSRNLHFVTALVKRFVNTESCDACYSPLFDDAFRQLKKIMPEVNSVYIRSDNAGCYHCAFSLLSVYHVAREHATELKRFDVSDPQGGKRSCDRTAATIKSHMCTHLNSGHDIETASQTMTAIVQSGGLSGVRVTVSGPQPAAKSTPVKWEGVSFINNIEYTRKVCMFGELMELALANLYPGATSANKLGVFLS